MFHSSFHSLVIGHCHLGGVEAITWKWLGNWGTFKSLEAISLNPSLHLNLKQGSCLSMSKGKQFRILTPSIHCIPLALHLTRFAVFFVTKHCYLFIFKHLYDCGFESNLFSHTEFMDALSSCSFSYWRGHHSLIWLAHVNKDFLPSEVSVLDIFGIVKFASLAT